MRPQILLAVADDERRAIYDSFLKRQRIICQYVTSLRDVAAQTSRQPYNAIFLDLPLIAAASLYEKSIVDDALRALPHAWLDITPASEEVTMLLTGKHHDYQVTPEEYVAYCCEQPVKRVLPRLRIPLHINALLSWPDSMETVERTACIDFSPGGCFLFTVNDDVQVESKVWVRLLALQDTTPILCTVCWKRGWGITSEMPGIGVRFDSMTDEQNRQILTLCRDNRGGAPDQGRESASSDAL